MNRRGATLVELMVALAAAGIVAFVAGKLLFAGLESWRVQADKETGQRRAILALDALADDLAAQPDRTDCAAPVTAFELNANTPRTAFFIATENLRDASVCWYFTGNSPWTLRRYEASADATEAALPANAALTYVTSALISKDTSDDTALDAASREVCRGVVSLEFVQPDVTLATQIFVEVLTPEGLRRVQNGETLANLPTRCIVRASRPVALP